jgi:molybdate transport system ATP-binding protein
MSGRFALLADFGAFRLDAAADLGDGATALFGASGSGKSTVLEAIAGLRPEVRGPIEIGGRRLDGLPASARRAGWVPQEAALFPRMSVRANLDFAARARGDAAAGAKAATRAVEFLELGALLGRRAADLSGGERQRVAIARALASRPAFLLLDEPLAAIDRPLRARIVPTLARIPTELAMPMVVVTHDPLEVAALAPRVIVLEGGRVVAQGATAELLPAAASFGALHAIGAENRFMVQVIERATGTLRLRTAGGCELAMADLEGFPAPERIAVRAEEILLANVEPRGLSAQNLLAGTIAALEPIGAQLHVDVRVRGVVNGTTDGERWRARVTRRAADQLALRPGAPVWLVIKAHSIQPG